MSWTFSKSSFPVVTCTFLALCYLVSVSSFLIPGLHDFLGGVGAEKPHWRYWTSAFQHGWPGVPKLMHLGLNTVLILAIGPPCERILGRLRFGALCVAASSAAYIAQVLFQGVNGSSIICYSWSPPVWLGMRRLQYADPEFRQTARYARLKTTLILMYAVITAAMTAAPYFAGYRGGPVYAVVFGNLFHGTATAVGVLAAVIFARSIRRRSGLLAMPKRSVPERLRNA